jgi:hypothetical protein
MLDSSARLFTNLDFSTYFLMSPIYNYTGTRPMGDALLYENRRTDIQEIGLFSEHAKTHKKLK